MSQNVTILGHWNSRKAKSPPSLSWGEERTKILLLACCYQEGLKFSAGHGLDGDSSVWRAGEWEAQGRAAPQTQHPPPSHQPSLVGGCILVGAVDATGGKAALQAGGL